MYFKSCLILGCGPLKGKERENAIVAQELLSEETLQQLLKQEKHWQLQNRKRNKENCILDSFAGEGCFLERFSSKESNDKKCPPLSLISAGSGLGSCTPLAAWLSAGQTEGPQTVCGMPQLCWDFTISLSCSRPENLQGCISLLCCWKTKSNSRWSQQWKHQLLQHFEDFQGNQVEISKSFHRVTWTLLTVLPIAIVFWA